MPRNFKVLLVALYVFLISGGAYAFAAANIVPDTSAGYKADVVSGYSASNIVYDLNATDPTLVDRITFDIAPASGTVLVHTVKIQTARGGGWTDCALGDRDGLSIAISCSYDSAPYLSFANVTALNIVASSTTDPLP